MKYRISYYDYRGATSTRTVNNAFSLWFALNVIIVFGDLEGVTRL